MIDSARRVPSKRKTRFYLPCLSHVSHCFARIIYVFLTPKKCFNPSAFFRNLLKISVKVAERFDFQTFQHCSAIHGLFGSAF